MKSLKYHARSLARDLLQNMADRRGFHTNDIDPATMRKWMDEWTQKIEQAFQHVKEESKRS